MVKKRIILNIAKRYQNISYAEDYLWWLKASEKTKILNMQKNLTYIRVSDNSRTSIGIVKNLKSLIYIYTKIYKFSFIKIALIFLRLFFNNFEKKFFYYS